MRKKRIKNPSVDLTARIGPIELPGPIVAASGTFGHGDEVARVCDPTILGAVTTKSLASFIWPGNPAPRLHPSPGGGMLNSVGLQGPGVAHWIDVELPALRARGARVIVSIWGRTASEFADATKLLAPAVTELMAIEINVSCPNLEDRARVFAHSCEATRVVVDSVAQCGLGLPLLAKLSPNTAELVEVAGTAMDAGADGLTMINTLVGFAIDAGTRRPVLGAGNGGLSGPPIKPIALRAVHDVAQALPGVPIIGTGGVSCGRDAVEMLLAGACAVGVGTASFRDPRAMLRIHDELLEWCGQNGIDRVAALTGAINGEGV